MADQKSLQGVEAEGIKKCPDCGSEDVVREDNEIYCQKCGSVID